jgi:uncharacterized protein with ParB-like and HNH nuclease domain
VKANETKFQKIIEGTNQFLVPHFQRPYTWKQEQWDVLWDDLVALAEDEGAVDSPRQHFVRSIVTMPGHSVPEGITKVPSHRRSATNHNTSIVPGGSA